MDQSSMGVKDGDTSITNKSHVTFREIISVENVLDDQKSMSQGNSSSNGTGKLRRSTSLERIPLTQATGRISNRKDKLRKAKSLTRPKSTKESMYCTSNDQVQEEPRILSKIDCLKKSEKFRKMVKKVFEDVDADKSGQVNKEELYCGLLLVHLDLARYAGNAAANVLAREKVDEIFDLIDLDHSGTLNEEEFMHTMIILFTNAVIKITIHLTLIIFFLPSLVQLVLYSFKEILHFILSLSAVHEIEHMIRSPISFGSKCIDLSSVPLSIRHLFPSTLLSFFSHVLELSVIFLLWRKIGIRIALLYALKNAPPVKQIPIMRIIPSSFFSNIPFAVIFLFLLNVAVPWAMTKIDEVFDRIIYKIGIEERKKYLASPIEEKTCLNNLRKSCHF